ncbi:MULTISPECIES: BON domain-containing protein [Stenotrophomonas]|uniref:BON domain-containing protein n=1 Tax=Stenotrophomonas TaxID=40323 RepID=UPI00077004FA|nr:MULTISPECIES: BON domain-containing protein [Stenotrophomonas]AMJ58417.1 hypothetical protein AXG53_18690 [Stenotrophomonas sp. KCTC 12332]
MDTRNMKKLLFAGMIAVGCAGTALTVQAAGQQAMQGHESEQPGTDTWITTKVKAELLTTKDVSGMEIKVETVNGVVSLSGTVATKVEADRAIAAAKGIKGVTSVDSSQLKVAGAHH